jgi:hypothetical protein
MMHDGMMWGMGFGGLLALVIALLVIAALIRGRPRPQASPIAAGGTTKLRFAAGTASPIQTTLWPA